MSLKLPHPLLEFEMLARAQGFLRVAGLDEAGRGPLAGPLVACACVIDHGIIFEGINDSKLLTPLKRAYFLKLLTEHEGVEYGVGQVSAREIDEIGIAAATRLAMTRGLDALQKAPDYLLIDAFPLSYKGLAFNNIIQGDRKSQSIAAASIIAKETRDAQMREYHVRYPEYGFDEHKGYGTKKHLEALNKLGPCALHRRSFAPIVD